MHPGFLTLEIGIARRASSRLLVATRTETDELDPLISEVANEIIFGERERCLGVGLPKMQGLELVSELLDEDEVVLFERDYLSFADEERHQRPPWLAGRKEDLGAATERHRAIEGQQPVRDKREDAAAPLWREPEAFLEG